MSIAGETSSAISLSAQIVPAVAIFFPLVVLRVILGALEEPYLRTVFRFPVQRRWASSFKVTGNGNSDNATPMAQYPSIRRIWPLISVYCFFSILVLTLLPVQIRFFSHRWGNRSVQNTFGGSLALAFLARMLEILLGSTWGIDNNEIRSDPMLAITLPYVWTFIELVLRNSYVLWLFAHNFNSSRNVEIAFNEDHLNEDRRTQWFRIIMSVSLAAAFIGYGLMYIVLGIMQTTAEILGSVRFLFIATGAGFLLLGCKIALLAYEEAFGRKCWLELKLLMVASGLRRLWSRNQYL